MTLLKAVASIADLEWTRQISRTQSKSRTEASLNAKVIAPLTALYGDRASEISEKQVMNFTIALEVKRQRNRKSTNCMS